MATNNSYSREDREYEDKDHMTLKELCRSRVLDGEGDRRALVKRLVERDRRVYYWYRLKFNDEIDPTGSKRLGQINEAATFEEKCEISLMLPRIEYYEILAKKEREKLQDNIKKVAAKKREDQLAHAQTVKRLSEKMAMESAAKKRDSGAKSISKTTKHAAKNGDESEQITGGGTSAGGNPEKQKKPAPIAEGPPRNPESPPSDAVGQDTTSQTKPQASASQKRSIDEADIPDASSAAAKKSKPIDSPQAAAVDIIEPYGLEEILVTEKQTFLQLSGPLIITIEKLQDIRNDLSCYNPIAVRADERAFYVIFDSEKKDGPSHPLLSDRQRCQSRVDTMTQHKQDTNVGIKGIDTMSSWRRGRKIVSEHAQRRFVWNGHN